jgi:cytochrome c
MKRWLAIFALAGFALSAVSSAHAQDADAGKTVFSKCLPCHAVGEGAVNKVGPLLNGLDGRKAGTIPGYSYTAANKASGITWSAAEFKTYIRDPQAKIPKTKMAFAGLTNDNDIANLWAYIAQFKDDGTKK